MRAGLRNKTLGTLLFPKDPIRNAPEIIRNLITTFPAEDGAYLFGLLMKITWFSPTLVYLDVAIMVEVGNRLRVIVLGMISALLPTRENDLVRLNMDALGLLDLGKMSIAVDAVLVDSRLAQKFVLTGDMALRASMAPGRRNFVMAVGGRHVVAVGFYLLVKRHNLVLPMFTGRKLSAHVPDGADLAFTRLSVALLLFFLSAGIAAWIMIQGGSLL